MTEWSDVSPQDIPSRNRGAALAATLAIAMLLGGCGGGGSGAVTLPISVSLFPAAAAVPAGTTLQSTATVANDSANKGVTAQKVSHWFDQCDLKRFDR